MIAKPAKVGLALVLVAGLGVVLLFIRMYRNDIKALKGFLAAYDRFDRAMPSAAGPVDPRELGPAEEALADLQARAAMKLSSLIRNDGDLMAQAREIADLAKREYKSQAGGPAKNRAALSDQRRAAFARFMALGGTQGPGRT